jgi:hypothetical protein
MPLDMANKTYSGSCHCGRVKFEADVDWSQGTTKCNCTYCWKKRWWSVKVQPSGFRSLGGESELSGYKPGQSKGHTGFCKHCGVTPYGWVEPADWNPAEYVSVNVAALDELDPLDLLAAPVTYCDGRADNWWSAPAETRHL